jgi:hypothetical protein
MTKSSTTNKYTSNPTHFDGLPIGGVQGFTQCHWTPPLGKYLHRIAPADNEVVCKQTTIKKITILVGRFAGPGGPPV